MKSAAQWLKAWIVAAIAISSLVFSVQAQAPEDVRIALVIGNSAYPNAPLANPGNDAKAMGETLRRLGFVVVELHDGLARGVVVAIEVAGGGADVSVELRQRLQPPDARADVAEPISGVETPSFGSIFGNANKIDLRLPRQR